MVNITIKTELCQKMTIHLKISKNVETSYTYFCYDCTHRNALILKGYLRWFGITLLSFKKLERILMEF